MIGLLHSSLLEPSCAFQRLEGQDPFQGSGVMPAGRQIPPPGKLCPANFAG
jgi:hypothetical protein